MSGNTQPISSEHISSTVKSMSTFQATLSIPVLNTYISEDGFEVDKIEGLVVPATQVVGNISVDTHDGYMIVASISAGNGAITNIDQKNGVISYISDGLASLKYDYISNNLLGLMLNVSSGKLSGNIDFKLAFRVFITDFEFDCKLTSLQMTTTPNDVPTLNVGLQR